MTLRPFALERFFARHEFTARYLLCSSDPESMSVGDLFAYEPDPGATGAEFQGLWLGYTETWAIRNCAKGSPLSTNPRWVRRGCSFAAGPGSPSLFP